VSADPLSVHGLGADPNAYAYVSGRALRAVDPTGLFGASRGSAPEVKPPSQALFEHALKPTDAKLAAKVVHAVNPGAALADRLGQGAGATAYATRRRDLRGAVSAVGRTVKDVTGAGAGTVESVVHDHVQTAKAASAVTQLALGRGSAVEHLDTLADYALHQASKAVVAAAAAAGGGGVASEAEAGTTGKIQRSISGVNPIDELGSDGRTNNCVNCAVATDATLSGSPAVALKSKRGLPVGLLEQHYGSKFGAPTTLTDIAQAMQEAGSGARGIVHASRGLGRVGHVFNVVNQDGTVRFLDGQTGKPAEVAGKGFQSYQLLRTDGK